MNKSELIEHIMTLRREIDGLIDAVIAMEDSEPEQPMQIQTENDGWLTVKQVCRELHISDSTFYEWLNQGLLPPGLEFGPRSKRWKMSDIRAWQEERLKSPSGVHHEVTRSVKRRGRPSRVMKIGALIHA